MAKIACDNLGRNMSKTTTALDLSNITPPSTPGATEALACQFYRDVQSIYDAVIALPTTKPGIQINTLLTDLVDMCIQPCSADFTSTFFSLPGAANLCIRLRSLLSEAEGELERFWAGAMIEMARDSDTSLVSQHLLDMFPYYQNYVNLSKLESSMIKTFIPTELKCFGFIGSGSLPLTSMCLLDQYPNAIAHNMDHDIQALSDSQELCRLLKYSERMEFSCEHISNTSLSQINWHSFQVVFLAALVGMDSTSKMSILSSLRKTLAPGTLVIVRSAHGMRTVLYPVFELSEELSKAGYDILAEVHPWTDVVNSIVVLRVRSC